MNNSRLIAQIGLIFTTAIWGSTFLLVQDSVSNETSPLLFIFFRFIIAASVLIPLLFNYSNKTITLNSFNIYDIKFGFNLIPFIGPIIGGLTAILLFLLSNQSDIFILQYYHILFIMATFISVQLIDNLISSPLIISDSVGLHPMFVIIVVLIGGGAMGIIGMLISVPVAAILKVIVEELIWGFKNYRYL